MFPEPLRNTTVVHIQGPGQPFRGIKQLQEIPLLSPLTVCLDYRLQKGRPQSSATEFQDVYQPQIVGRIFRSDKRRLKNPGRLIPQETDTSQHAVEPKVLLSDKSCIGKSDMGIMSKFERTVQDTPFIGQEFQMQIRPCLSALLHQIEQEIRTSIQTAVQNNPGGQTKGRSLYVQKTVMDFGVGLQERVDTGNRFQACCCLRAEIAKGLEKIIIIKDQALQTALGKESLQA